MERRGWHLKTLGDFDDEVSRAAITAAFLEQVLGEKRFGQAVDVVKLQLQMDFATAKKEERAEAKKVTEAMKAVEQAKADLKAAQDNFEGASEADKEALRQLTETAAEKVAEVEGRAAALAGTSRTCRSRS